MNNLLHLIYNNGRRISVLYVTSLWLLIATTSAVGKQCDLSYLMCILLRLKITSLNNVRR